MGLQRLPLEALAGGDLAMSQLSLADVLAGGGAWPKRQGWWL